MYQVLYRKWRPRVFSDVIGQPHITKTLSGEIEESHLSHAYLFTGSRGTGKTTCAKILAKAVNCLNPKNGDPCNECEICRGLDAGSILDVVEIDAASNNGVDNIRDIREEVNFAPANCKYRVYIIDEVHMLSAGAFNALLKTLEEPPSHVIFILATTEVQKLPATILSRCQRFDFRRIPSEDMSSRLIYIAEREGFTLEHDAAMLIARLSDGAMRDALSILDQCGTRSKEITATVVSEAAGLTGRIYLGELADAISGNDASRALELVSMLHANSCDMERLCTELINHFRNLMIYKSVRKVGDLVVCTEQEHKQLRLQSDGFTLDSIIFAIDALQRALLNIKRGVNRRVEMEMTVLTLCSPSLSTDSKAMLKRISALENSVKRFAAEGSVFSEASVPKKTEDSTAKPSLCEIPPQAQAPNQTEPEAEKAADAVADNSAAPETTLQEPQTSAPTQEHTQSGDEPAQDAAETIAFGQWPEVIAELSEINKPLWGILVGSSAYVRDNLILIKSDNTSLGSFIRIGSNVNNLLLAIFNVTGQRYKLGLFKQPTQKETSPRDSLEGLIGRVSGTSIKLTVTDE